MCRKTAFWIVFVACCVLPLRSLQAQHGEHGEAHAHEEAAAGERHVPHQPRDHTAYMTMLERDDRDEYQKPDEVVRALGLEPGMRVADIGAGSGYFTRRIAPRVQPDGIVYALDIEEPFLARIRADAERFGIGNIRTVLTQPDRPDLPDDSVDMVLFVNTWHHIANPDAYLRHVRRILRPGGTFVHVDWKKMETPHGPPMDHRLSRDELYEEMKKGGFELRSEHFFLRWHYFLVFQDAGSR